MRLIIFLLVSISFNAQAQKIGDKPIYIHRASQPQTFTAEPIPDINKIKASIQRIESKANVLTSATLTVGPGCTYANIQQAVNAALDGDIIRVRNTTFTGSDATVNINNKSLVINGGYGVNCTNLTTTRTILDAAGEADSIIELTDSIGGMTSFISNMYLKNGEDDGDYGGGVEISGLSGNPLNTTLINVKITNSQSTRGGAIHVSDGQLQLLQGTIIYSNTATSNGGAVYCSNSSIEIVDSDIGWLFGNVASNHGGGFYLNNCDLTLSAVVGNNSAKIHFNTAGASGGGVYASNDSRIDLQGDLASITSNNAVRGGGVYLNSASNLFNSNGKISFNNASLYGGGFYLNGVSSGFTMNLDDNYACTGKCGWRRQ